MHADQKIALDALCPEIFGFSTRRYRQLAEEGILPKPVKGSLDLLKAVKAVIAYKDKLLEGSGSLDLTEERTRLTRIQADRKELDFKQATGELISTALTMTLYGAILQNVKTRATGMPTKLAPLLYGREMAEIKAILERHIDEMLNEFASPDLAATARVANANGNMADVKARPAAKRKPVGRPRKGTKPGRQRRAGPVVHGQG
jgi:phage terminase Nu1 subunit (DNA packaging protein)